MNVIDNKQLKVSSFYGNQVARPFLILENGLKVESRVDAPSVNESLIQWASKVPFKEGGALMKPTWKGKEPPPIRKARNPLQIMIDELGHKSIASAFPHLSLSLGNTSKHSKEFLEIARIYWNTMLKDADRTEYKRKAKEERVDFDRAIIETEDNDPQYKKYREALSKHAAAVRQVSSAKLAQSAPLWKLQRGRDRKNQKQREEDDIVEEEEEEPKRKKRKVTTTTKSTTTDTEQDTKDKDKKKKKTKKTDSMKVSKGKQSNGGGGVTKFRGRNKVKKMMTMMKKPSTAATKKEKKKKKNEPVVKEEHGGRSRSSTRSKKSSK